MPLTDTWLKKNLDRERSAIHTEPDQDGLSVRVSQKGKLTFQMRFRYNLEKGHDPRIHKKVELHKITEAITFEALFREWHTKYSIPNKKNADQYLRSFELYVFPKLGEIPAEQITLHMWLDLLEEQFKQSPSITDRILTNTKQCLDWGINRKLIEQNPIRHITGKRDLNIKKNKTVRVLQDDELSLIFKICDESRTSLRNVLFLKLCLFYGNRYSELRLARKSDFDFSKNTWTVPYENHKTGESKGDIVRPIIDEIKPWLQSAMDLSISEYIFPHENGKEPMGRSGPTDTPYNFMQFARKNYKIEMDHWSMHDLRPGEQGTYDYYDYQKEMSKAYKKWWKKLSNLSS